MVSKAYDTLDSSRQKYTVRHTRHVSVNTKTVVEKNFPGPELLVPTIRNIGYVRVIDVDGILCDIAQQYMDSYTYSICYSVLLFSLNTV